MISDRDFAMAAAALTTEAFKRRVYQCDDVNRLRATIEYECERDGEPRRERIAVCNKRLQRLSD